MFSFIIIGFLILIVTVWGAIAIKKYSNKKNDKNLIVINSIASLAAIIGLLITLIIFNCDQYEKNQEKLKRISALKFELKVNRENADIILSTIKNDGIPETRYEISIIARMLQSGEIPQKDITLFWNSYILMKTSNNLLDKALTIQFYEHVADPRDMISRSGRKNKINELLQWIDKSSSNNISILDSLIIKL